MRRHHIRPPFTVATLTLALTMSMVSPFSAVKASDGGDDRRSISGETPFPPGCDLPAHVHEERGSETQPHLAVNPLKPQNMVVTWAQDNAAGIVVAVTHDGGETWTKSIPPETSVCSGGTYTTAYKTRVSFSADGRLYLSSEGKDADIRSRATVHVSTDGGTSWSAPVTLEEGTIANLITWPMVVADPTRPDTAYAAWYRTDYSDATNSVPGLVMRFARTEDGGATWFASREISPAPDGYDHALPQLLVLPDGSLVNIFLRVLDWPIDDDHRAGTATVMAARSTDRGESWSPAVEVAARDVPGRDDPRLDKLAIGQDGVHGLLSVPTVSGDGTIHYAWPDIAADDSSTIYRTSSSDGGRTWTAPAAVRRSNVPMAATDIAVADDGTLGILFYDFRNDAVADDDVATTDVWLLTAPANGLGPWVERHVAGWFDAFTVPDHIGWNQGFVGADNGFLAAYTLGEPLSTVGRSDIFYSVAEPTIAGTVEGWEGPGVPRGTVTAPFLASEPE